jgi:CelD/BcsL family acetyltransferase involved in cellulose biosynthesis
LSKAATVAEARAFFETLKEFHSATWQQRSRAHSFTRAFFEPFHQLLFERSFAAGGIELLRASAGDAVIGHLYNFRLGNRIYAYRSGFAYDERAARPGAVSHAMAIREAYRSGAAIYDFMAERNRLQESFATRCEPMLWQVMQQPRLAFRLEHFARNAKRAAEGALAGLRRQKNVAAVAADDRGTGPHRGLPEARNRNNLERSLIIGKRMSVLLTGAAGFIGFHVAKALLDRDERIVGIDNLNNYYDVKLKEVRLAQLRA